MDTPAHTFHLPETVGSAVLTGEPKGTTPYHECEPEWLLPIYPLP